MPQADAAADELNVVLEEFRRAQEAFCRGDGEPVKRWFSRRDDVTLGNPLGPVARGWPDVEDTIERAAANFRDGGDVRYEEISRYVTPEQRVVWINRRSGVAHTTPECRALADVPARAAHATRSATSASRATR